LAAEALISARPKWRSHLIRLFRDVHIFARLVRADPGFNPPHAQEAPVFRKFSNNPSDGRPESVHPKPLPCAFRQLWKKPKPAKKFGFKRNQIGYN
jgi:hypothetical protein